MKTKKWIFLLLATVSMMVAAMEEGYCVGSCSATSGCGEATAFISSVRYCRSFGLTHAAEASGFCDGVRHKDSRKCLNWPDDHDPN